MMYKILNYFLKTDYFDRLPKFISKKIFKIFKIFFVETNLNFLPQDNHPTKIDKHNQPNILKNSEDRFYKPFSTCAYLLEIFTLYASIKKNIKVLDFGANNIDNYIYLSRYIKDWEYFYHDLPNYNDYVSNLISQKNLNKITVINKIIEVPNELDFIFFGSSIHYVNNYKEILTNMCQKKPKYFIFSHTPFYISHKNDKDIVMKQVNIHPTINYAYLLEYNNFINFMKKNNYKLISQNKNNFIKFLNFKNFQNFSFLNFLDLIFVNNNS